MYREDGPHVGIVYEASDLWVQRHLASDGSLFSSDSSRSIATKANVAALYDAFVNHPDEGKESFAAKLRGQLKAQPDDVAQLAAEALFILLLPASPRTIGGPAKRQMIKQVLSGAPGSDPLPEKLSAALDSGLARMGMAFLNIIWRQYQFLLEFLNQWKHSPEANRDRWLADPVAFREFLFGLPIASAFTERYAIAHLVFPDTFLAVVSQEHRSRLLQYFADRITDPSGNEDEQLAEVASSLVAEYGPDADLYAPPIVTLWQERSGKWTAFTAWVRKVAETVDLESEETNYKLLLADRVADVRRALFEESDDWLKAMKAAMTARENNLVSWQAYEKFLAWAEGSPTDCADGLTALWADDQPAPYRVQRFLDALPAEAPSGLGARLSIAAYLLMGVDPQGSPPYRSEALATSYKLAGYGKPHYDAAFDHYQHAIRFFDFMIADAAKDGWTIRSRLEAQSLAWIVVHGPRDEWSSADREAYAAWIAGEVTSLPDVAANAGPRPIRTMDGLTDLADELYLPESFLTEIVRLLDDRKQVIFYGPPGTGKTYVARALANQLAGDPSRVTFVQFHAAYAYEDFVEGIRPRPDGNFHLVEGPLRRIARDAATSTHTHVLVIDEINRANVARVLGELYFLLEYRDQPATLLYSEELFSLPKNLLIIATMNSADRSISLIDTALRRRFYFIGFFPDRMPVSGLLRTYLSREHPNMIWLADVFAMVNKQLEGSGTSVGPSYFIREALDELWVQTIWAHSVMPALEDHFFGQESMLQDFTLDRLRIVSAIEGADEQLADESDGSADTY